MPEKLSQLDEIGQYQCCLMRPNIADPGKKLWQLKSAVSGKMPFSVPFLGE
jgi:hypothetical protein